MGGEGEAEGQRNESSQNSINAEDIKRKISRFEAARKAFYGDGYQDSHFLKKGWMNFYSYYRLKRVDLSDKLPNLWKSIKGGAGWLKDSVFGSNVKKAGLKAATGGKVVGKAAIEGTKLVGRGIASIVRNQKDDTVREAKAMADAAMRKPVIRFLARKTQAANRAVRDWLKEKAAHIMARSRETAGRHEAHTPKKPLELKTREEIALAKEKLKKKKEAPKEVPKKHRLSISDAAGILWSGIRLSGRAVWSATKAVAKSKAVQTVKNGVVAAAKGIAKGAGFAGRKTVEGLRLAAGHAADGYNYVISRKTDILYQWNRRRAIDQNVIHEAMDALAGGKEYTDRLKAFENSLKADKEINLRLQLRANVLRLRENVRPMSEGQTGTVELRELDENGKYKAPAEGQGMIMNPGREDLGDALIEEEKAPISKLQKKAPEEEKKEPERVSFHEVNQEQNDRDLLIRKGLDPAHLPKQPSTVMKLVGQSAKIVKKAGKEAGSLDAIRKAAIDKLKKLNEKPESGDGFYNDNIRNEIDSDITLIEHGMNAVKSNTEIKPDAKSIGKAAADDIIFTEAVLNKIGVEVPISGLGKTIYNVLNIADENEREKNIAALCSNGLQQAGRILEQFAGKNIVSELSGIMNSGDVDLAGRVGGTVQAAKDGDAIEQKKQYVRNIASGVKALNQVLEKFQANSMLQDVDVFLNPFIDILDNVKKYNELEKKKEKLNQLTEEELSKNITDTNTVRQLGLGAKDLSNQIDLQKKGVVADAILDTGLTALKIASGGNAAVSVAGKALAQVSPTQLLLHQLKHQTDSELMMRDVFGNMEKYREYKDRYRLSERQVQDEIKKLTSSATVKEYASRVRAEVAMHLHARSKLAEKSGLENGATKLRETGGIEGDTMKEVYKKIGGDLNFENVTGSTKTEAYREKAAEQKAAQTKKKQEETFENLEKQAKNPVKKNH